MPGPTGRLRSKTSDLSDLWRNASSGSSSHPKPSDSLTPSVPQLPETATTPTKSKRRLPLFGRRRKSNSPSPSSTSSRGEPEPPSPKDVPPVPTRNAAEASTITPASSASVSSSLPSSLPPLNVSPPSFGTLSQFNPPKSRPSESGTIHSDFEQGISHLKPLAFRTIRGQKSTSFEHVGRNTKFTAQSEAQNQDRTERPVITVSAPPQTVPEDDTEVFNSTPRTAPTPPPPSRISRSARKPLMFAFSNSSKKDQSSAIVPPAAPPKGAMTPTPPLPPSMRFPVPPAVHASQLPSALKHESASRKGQAQAQETEDVVPRSPSSVKTSFSARSSLPIGRLSRDTLKDLPSTPEKQDKEKYAPQASSSASSSLKQPMTRTSPETVPTLRPRTLTYAGKSAHTPTTTGPSSIAGSSSLRIRPITYTSSVTGGKTTAHTRAAPLSPIHTNSLRRSASPSPASSPPTAPLPEPPLSAGPSVSSHLSAGTPEHLTVESRDQGGGGKGGGGEGAGGAGGEMSAMPAIPSLASVKTRRSLASVHQRMFRTRTRSGSGAEEQSAKEKEKKEKERERETEKEREREREKEKEREREREKEREKEKEKAKEKDMGDLAHCMPSFGQSRSHDKERKDKALEGPTAVRTSAAEVDQMMFVQEIGALRATHEAQLRVLCDKHAAERAELLKRVEQLEREARKREREIKGLRWLVMNAGTTDIAAGKATGPGTGASGSPLRMSDVSGRFRSSSKASEMSYGSSSVTGATATYQRPDTATSRVSMNSPRGSTEEGLLEIQSAVSDLISPPSTSPDMTRPPPPSGREGPRRTRRANTMPDGHAQPPVAIVQMAKQARRTSSPVIPIVLGVVPLPGARPGSASEPRGMVGAGAGLGFEIPTIPSSESQSSLSAMPSMPSLTGTTSTASSGLSAIPESPRYSPMSLEETQQEREKREKDERRASRALKRISASSTSSSLLSSSSSGVGAQAGSLNLGRSPSISQILDRTGDTDMDEVLKKLRAFGGGG